MNELMRKLLALPEQASTVAAEIDALHYFVISVTTLGALGVALAVLVFLIRYRDRGGRTQAPPSDAESRRVTRIEAGAIVGLLSLFLLWWGLGMRQYLHLSTPPRDSMDVYVVGKQWMWTFAYPDGRGSQNVLYVPVDRPIRLVMTSRDVIHSFYVPAFRIKKDVVPGRTTTAWFEVNRPGRYQVLCAEYCGLDHSRMRAEVVALSADDYARHLDEVAGEAPPLAALGEEVAARAGCFRCHTVDGTAHIGPTWAGLYRSEIRLTSGETIVADAAYLTDSMMDPTANIHVGFRPVMPSYLGRLTPPEVASIVELIRSLGDRPIVEPQVETPPSETREEEANPLGAPLREQRPTGKQPPAPSPLDPEVR